MREVKCFRHVSTRFPLIVVSISIHSSMQSLSQAVLFWAIAAQHGFYTSSAYFISVEIWRLVRPIQDLEIPFTEVPFLHCLDSKLGIIDPAMFCLQCSHWWEVFVHNLMIEGPFHFVLQAHWYFFGLFWPYDSPPILLCIIQKVSGKLFLDMFWHKCWDLLGTAGFYCGFIGTSSSLFSR